MDDVFVDFFGYKRSEELFLFRLRRAKVSLRGQVMRVFLSHDVQVVLLDVLNNF